VVTTFIDDHKARFGVAPICTVLSKHGVEIAPSSYYAAKTRPVSARAARDSELVVKIHAVFAARDKGRGVAGVRKVWHLLKRDDVQVARCTVERLMRQEGLRGMVRGKKIVTTRRDETAPRPADLVNRAFTASEPVNFSV
jgi:putative transposase